MSIRRAARSEIAPVAGAAARQRIGCPHCAVPDSRHRAPTPLIINMSEKGNMTNELPDSFCEAVAQHTGVPTSFLRGATPAEVWESARVAAKWAAATATPPPTAAGPALPQVSQFSRESLVYLDADQINAAYHQGRLAAIGGPAPQPRNGHHHHAAP
jgi:hypothetical protein